MGDWGGGVGVVEGGKTETKPAPLSQPMKSWFPVFASNFDWLVSSFAFVVIGSSTYFDFGLRDSIEKGSITK